MLTSNRAAESAIQARDDHTGCCSAYNRPSTNTAALAAATDFCHDLGSTPTAISAEATANHLPHCASSVEDLTVAITHLRDVDLDRFEITFPA